MRSPANGLTLLDSVLPVFHFHEVHSTLVRAAPDHVVTAVKSVTPAEIAFLHFLMRLRALPARLRGVSSLRVAGERPLLDQFLAAGFMLLAEVPARELVVGRIEQFWRLWGGTFPVVASAVEFLRFEQPGYAKVAVNFLLERVPGGQTRVSTETRIAATDRVARRKFAAYWAVIFLGSAFIRRMWLQAIRRRAERIEARVRQRDE